VLFRNLRAAAESGWDFSSRWFKDGKSFGSIHTTDIIPWIELPSFSPEQVLAEAYQISGNERSRELPPTGESKKIVLIKYCWNEERKFFFDFDFVEQKQKNNIRWLLHFLFFFEMASPAQALAVETVVRRDFLKAGW